MSKWTQPRQAVAKGEVVFFPRTSVQKAYSILSYERKQGMKVKARSAVYQECPGVVLWRVE